MALMGIDMADCSKVGELVGIKVFLSTFVAYIRLADLINNRHALESHVASNGTYAMDGDDIVLLGTDVRLVNGVMQVRRYAMLRLSASERLVQSVVLLRLAHAITHALVNTFRQCNHACVVWPLYMTICKIEDTQPHIQSNTRTIPYRYICHFFLFKEVCPLSLVAI